MAGLPSIGGILQGLQMPAIPQIPYVGQILSMIGGVPIQHAAKHVVEKLLTSRNMIVGGGGGGGSSGAASAMSGGLESVFSNPISSITSQLSSTISGAVGQLGQLGSVASPIVNALSGGSGLQNSVSNLLNITNVMSGVRLPSQGQFGISEMISHSGLLNSLGSAIPPELSMTRVVAPLMMSDQLVAMNAALLQAIDRYIAAQMDLKTTLDQILQMRNTIDQTIVGSQSAMENLQRLIPAISQVSTVLAAISSDIGGPELQAALAKVVKAEFYSPLVNDATQDIGPAVPGSPDLPITPPVPRPPDIIQIIPPLS